MLGAVVVTVGGCASDLAADRHVLRDDGATGLVASQHRNLSVRKAALSCLRNEVASQAVRCHAPQLQLIAHRASAEIY